jgi:hypothetical protein
MKTHAPSLRHVNRTGSMLMSPRRRLSSPVFQRSLSVSSFSISAFHLPFPFQRFSVSSSILYLFSRLEKEKEPRKLMHEQGKKSPEAEMEREKEKGNGNGNGNGESLDRAESLEK